MKSLISLLLGCCLLGFITGCASEGGSGVPTTGTGLGTDLASGDGISDESTNAETATPDQENANQDSEQSPQTSVDQEEPNADVAAMLAENEYPASRAEMALTWNASLVKVPDGSGGVIKSSISELENGAISINGPVPVAIYLHGCDGFWFGSDYRMDWLASQGYVTIAPNSFARSFYPESCNVVSRTGWQYKPIISMRQFDTGYALEQVRQFPWVDTQNIVLYGFSEGAVISANFNSTNPKHQVSARVLEGWSCVSIPWEEYQGMHVPESEPVLTLIADRDPWLQGDPLTVSCADFISQTNGSQSVTVDYEPLRNSHTLLEDAAIQEIVLNFLLQQQSSNSVE